MSLTSELRSPESVVSCWFATRLVPAAVDDCVRYVNDTVARRWALRPPDTDPALAGMAFDYVFRWLLGPLEAAAARQGALLCAGAGWASASTVVESLIATGDAQPDLLVRARLAVCLSWFEVVYRAGAVPRSLQPFVARSASAALVAELCAAAPAGTVADVAALAATIPGVWGDDLRLPFVLNPTFAGSDLVGGADADWIAGPTLYDCKCSGRRRPFEANHLFQVLGYVLLDRDNRYALGRVGWYFARQQALYCFRTSAPHGSR